MRFNTHLSVMAGFALLGRALAKDEGYVETAAFCKSVSVVFSGATATVDNQAGPGVSYSQTGAVLVFTSTVKQVAFTLSGSTPAGSVKIYSDNAFKPVLNSAALISPNGPAVNIQSHKPCYLVLPDSTASTLTDNATYTTQRDATNGVEDAKGVLFSEGELLVSGTGTLRITGVCAEKHGLCSDDSVRILGGDLRVAMSKKKSDGVHVNDRFRMDGGRLAVTLALKGDGIDADDSGAVAINGGQVAISLGDADSKGVKSGTNTFEVTGGALSVTSAANDCNGLSAGGDMRFDGGLVNVAFSGTNCNAGKSDGPLTVNNGAFTLAVGGAASKGVKSLRDAVFNGGSLWLRVSGDTLLETVTNALAYKDPSYCSGVKASNVVLNAGQFSMLITGLAGRGFSADNDITVRGGTLSLSACVGVTAAFTNSAGIFDVAASTCLKADRSLVVQGGTHVLSVTAPAGRGFSADTSALFTGGSLDLELSGGVVFVDQGRYKDVSYCTGIKGDGGVTISNGTFAIRHTGVAGRGISTDAGMVVAGGALDITTTGTNTYVYTSGVYVVNGAVSNYLDVGSAAAIKADGNLALLGGTLNLLATGTSGKGLNVAGALTVGTLGSASGPSLAVAT